MIKAEWLFQNHTYHQAMVKLYAEAVIMRDDEISSMVLTRRPLDGMPHIASSTSSTERAVLALAKHESTDNPISPAATLQHFKQYINLFDSVMMILNDKERWFINHYYIQGLSLTALADVPQSPFATSARSTVWYFKGRLLSKADSFLSTL